MENLFRKVKLSLPLLLLITGLSACNKESDSSAASQSTMAMEEGTATNLSKSPSISGTLPQTSSGSEFKPEVFRLNSNWGRRGRQLLRQLYGLEFGHSFRSTNTYFVLPCFLMATEMSKIQKDLLVSIEQCFAAMTEVKILAHSVLMRYQDSNSGDRLRNEISDEKLIIRINATSALIEATKHSSSREIANILTNSANIINLAMTEEASLETVYFGIQELILQLQEKRRKIGEAIFDRFYSADPDLQKAFRQQTIKGLLFLGKKRSQLSEGIPLPSNEYSTFQTLADLSRHQLIELEKIRVNILSQDASDKALQSLLIRMPVQSAQIEASIIDTNHRLEISSERIQRTLQKQSLNKVHRWFVRHESDFEVGLAAVISLLEAREPQKAERLRKIAGTGIKLHNTLIDIVRNVGNLPSLLAITIHSAADLFGIKSSTELERSLILQQLDIVHSNLSKIHTEMYERLGRLDFSLAQALKGLEKIQKMQVQEFSEIKSQLYALREQLAKHDKRIPGTVRHILESDYSQTERACLGPNSALFASASKVSSVEVTAADSSPASCLANFVSRSKQRLAISENDIPKSSWDSLPIFQCKYLGVCDGVLNPKNWYLGANAYLDYISKAGLVSRRQVNTLQELINTGEEIIRNWQSMGSLEARKQVILFWQNQAQELQESIREGIRNYELANFLGIKMNKLAIGVYENHDPKNTPLEVGYKLKRMSMPDFIESHVDFGRGYTDYREESYKIRNIGTIALRSGTKAFWVEGDGSKTFLGYYKTYSYAARKRFNFEFCGDSRRRPRRYPKNRIDCKIAVVDHTIERFIRIIRKERKNFQPEPTHIPALHNEITKKLREQYAPVIAEWKKHQTEALKEEKTQTLLHNWVQTSNQLKQYRRFFFEAALQAESMPDISKSSFEPLWAEASSVKDYFGLVDHFIDSDVDYPALQMFEEELTMANSLDLSKAQLLLEKLRWVYAEANAQ